MKKRLLSGGTNILREVFIKIGCLLIVAVVAAVLLTDLMYPIKYSQSVNNYAAQYGVDQSDVYAIIHTESKFRSETVSAAGAVGLMQLMPDTAQWIADQIGIEYNDEMLLDADYNIRLGIWYLAYLSRKFDGEYIYAAYNAGEGNVARWLMEDGTIRFGETRAYVKRVRMARRVYKLKQHRK